MMAITSGMGISIPNVIDPNDENTIDILVSRRILSIVGAPLFTIFGQIGYRINIRRSAQNIRTGLSRSTRGNI